MIISKTTFCKKIIYIIVKIVVSVNQRATHAAASRQL